MSIRLFVLWPNTASWFTRHSGLFDVVRDFLQDEALGGEERVLAQVSQTRSVDRA
jgi:hypothetical protein